MNTRYHAQTKAFCQRGGWGGGGGGGGGGRSKPVGQKTALAMFFLKSSNYFTVYGFISEKTILFQGFRGGPTFLRGGGGPTFSRVWGVGWGGGGPNAFCYYHVLFTKLSGA